ncbi:unnamed protein product [Chrysodeixis includens]|uniref:Uncharacterized protein n=1 Tax=Chrysodeixis includens TaxID=689277 RepID=A0A9P0FQQ6_CHRIL|nr:unnamed protein product [Chrysodeixis includens]
MFNVVISLAVFAALLSVCYGAPSAICGGSPDNLFLCSTVPLLVGEEANRRCAAVTEECEKVNCLLDESMLMEDNEVMHERFALVLTEFAKTSPEYAPAVEAAISECLNRTLEPQGIHLNCPAYDVTYCMYIRFLRVSAATNWSPAESCAASREYARSCPICPPECATIDIPTGSCNACSVTNLNV